jgi:hypothetical protein
MMSDHTVRERIEAQAVLCMRQQIPPQPYSVQPMVRATSRLKWLLLLLKEDLSDGDLLLQYMAGIGDFPV